MPIIYAGSACTIIQIEEGKTGVPGEKPLGARTRTNNKLNPHVTLRLGIHPGPHWWETSATTHTNNTTLHDYLSYTTITKLHYIA